MIAFNPVNAGREILQQMRFISDGTRNFGYPKLCPVPSETRKESDQEVAAIRAFLATTPLVEKEHYEWSYWGQGRQGVLNLTEAGLILLNRALESSPTIGVGGPEVG